ncbi:MAG: hypothetical protein VX589_03340 [Myxococcota bacterium]|nr:hypothetical protein [Myxococcota bacterium]
MKKSLYGLLGLCVMAAGCGTGGGGGDDGAGGTATSLAPTSPTGAGQDNETTPSPNSVETTGNMEGTANDSGQVATPNYEVPMALTQPVPETDPGGDAACPADTLNTVRGWVADENGQGLAGAKAQVCVKMGEMTQCLQPVDTVADGTFTLELGDNRCVTSAAFRVIQPGSDRSAMYCEIPMDKRDGTRLTLTQPMQLYPTTIAVDIPEEGDGLQVRTIKFSDGLEIDMIPLDGPGYADLASTTFAGVPANLCFLDGKKTPQRTYAFSPDGGIYNGGAAFRVPNPDGLAVGTQVDFHVLGGLGCSDKDGNAIKEGDWFKLGTGTVDEQGITPDDGLKLTCLTWLGITPQE